MPFACAFFAGIAVHVVLRDDSVGDRESGRHNVDVHLLLGVLLATGTGLAWVLPMRAVFALAGHL